MATNDKAVVVAERTKLVLSDPDGIERVLILNEGQEIPKAFASKHKVKVRDTRARTAKMPSPVMPQYGALPEPEGEPDDRRAGLSEQNKDDLEELAASLNIEGRSSMKKDELVDAILEAEG